MPLYAPTAVSRSSAEQSFASASLIAIEAASAAAACAACCAAEFDGATYESSEGKRGVDGPRKSERSNWNGS